MPGTQTAPIATVATPWISPATTAAPASTTAEVPKICALSAAISACHANEFEADRVWANLSLIVGADVHVDEMVARRGYSWSEDYKADLWDETWVQEADGSFILTGVLQQTEDGVGLTPLGSYKEGVLKCLISELPIPARVEEALYATRAPDGRQTSTWDDLTAEFTYHPDDGLRIILYET